MKPSHDLSVYSAFYAVLPVAAVYLSGIVYISAYLAEFGIFLHEIDISIPIVLSYASNVFVSVRFFLSFGLVILTAFFINTIKQSIHDKITLFCSTELGKFLLLALSAVGLLSLIAITADYEAKQDAKKAWDRPIAKTLLENIDERKFILSKYNRDLFRICLEKKSFQLVFASNTVVFSLCKNIERSGNAIIISQKKDEPSVTSARLIKDKK